MIERMNLMVLISFGVLVVLMSAIAVYAHTRPTNFCQSKPEHVQLNSAVIYFIDWNVLTRHSYSIHDVRSKADIVETINETDDLACLTTLISEELFEPSSRVPDKLDGRLLIEGTDKRGEAITFFADRFEFCSVEQKACRENTEGRRFDIADYIRKLGS